MTEPDEFTERLYYRLAFGYACNLVESWRQDRDPQSNRETPAEMVSEILVAAAERVGRDPSDETVRNAVQDACTGRDPRG